MSELAATVRRDVVVVGASAGGVSALLALCRDLPAGFPAAVLVVLHIGTHPSTLPALLTSAGHIPAVHPKQGERLRHGTIYVAPPDHHMLVEDGAIRLTRDAKENYARPAIDPLFRSAALAYGPRVIGVVLTGRLNDGTAGLQAVKDAGGVAVVQDPVDAQYETMPQSALRTVPVDCCVPLAHIGETLVKLVNEPVAGSTADPAALRQWTLEQEVARGAPDGVAKLNAAGTRSEFSCPECHGVLWEIDDVRMRRFRCHTGHAYSLLSLLHAERLGTEEAIWNAMRSLQVGERLVRALADESSRLGDDVAGERLGLDAEKLARHALSLREMLPQLLDEDTSKSQ